MSRLENIGYAFTKAKTIALGCNSSSEARIEDITTPKMFDAIFDAISFAKAMSYPMTTELIKELALISDSSYKKHAKQLIEAILKLQQYADDLYSLNRGRKVYGEKPNQCLIDKDGIVVSEDEEEIKIVEKISESNKNNKMNQNCSTLLESIYVLQKEFILLSKLLSNTFLCQVPNGAFYTDNPLKFYFIEPMKHNPVEMIGDPKWEKYEIRFINAIFFGTGSDKALMFDTLKQSFSDIVGSLVGYSLRRHKVESGHKLKKSRTIETLGIHLLKVYIKSVLGKGHIHSKNPSLHYLHHRTTTNLVTKLFVKGKSWKAGGYSISYEPTPQMEVIVYEAFESFMKIPVLEITDNIERAFVQNTNIEYFHKDALFQMHIKDKVFLMSRVVGYKDNKYYFRIDAKDEQSSRIYSSITALKSESREVMGFYNYDMSVAQTSICLHLVQDTSKYPQHQEMVSNKRKYRNKIQELTGWDYKRVKKELSALDNGKSINGYTKRIKRALQPFVDESIAMMEDVLKSVQENDPIIYAQAVLMAKDSMKHGEVIGKKPASIYFFIWTQYERRIRDSMKSCFTMPAYDCHDAVYSREIVDVIVLEDKVLKDTGFNVKIES